MKLEWKSFLEKTGAEFEDHIVRSFGNQLRETKIVFNGDIYTGPGRFPVRQE